MKIRRVVVLSFLLIAMAGTVRSTGPGETDPDWSQLVASMETMHRAMASVEPSGDADADFVRLMLPHHQAAVDMARVELVHGTDPQMRRLAQEIITDQQSEIELMRLWLEKREKEHSR